MDRVYPSGLCHREKNGHQHQYGGGGIHKHTPDQQNDVDDYQYTQRGAGESADEGGELSGDVLDGQHVGESGGTGNDQIDGGRLDQHILADDQALGQGDVLIQEGGDAKRVGQGYGGGLGGGKHAGIHTHQNDDYGHQGENGLHGDLDGSTEGDLFGALGHFHKAALNEDHNGAAQTDQQSRHGTAPEESAGGESCGGGYQHSGDAGRNQRPLDGGGGGNGAGEVLGVALLLHGGDQNGAKGGDIRQGGAGDPGEEGGGQGIDVGKAAPDPAHQKVREPDNGGGDTAPVHDLSAHDEHGNGQQHKAVHATEHFLNDYHQQGNLAYGYAVYQAGEGHDEDDGHTQKHEYSKDNQSNG